MSIKINEKNREKIETMIKAAEGRTTARCISYESIDQAIKQIEDKFSFATKKSMIGLEVWCDMSAEKLPKAYEKASHGTRPQSTQFTVAYTASGWALLEVSRQDLRTHYKKKYIVEHMPDTLKKAIEEEFTVFGFWGWL